MEFQLNQVLSDYGYSGITSNGNRSVQLCHLALSAVLNYIPSRKVDTEQLRIIKTFHLITSHGKGFIAYEENLLHESETSSPFQPQSPYVLVNCQTVNMILLKCVHDELLDFSTAKLLKIQCTCVLCQTVWQFISTLPDSQFSQEFLKNMAWKI